MVEEAQLQKEGWIKRFVASEPRLSEAVELYKAIGFEVLVVPYRQDPQDSTCRTCMDEAADTLRVIYTRPCSPKPQ